MTPDTILLTAEEAARLLAISRSVFYSRVRDGKLPGPIPLGGNVARWRRADLESYVAGLTPVAAGGR